MQKNNSIAICGAGIAGVATAYYLLMGNSEIEIILIDKNQPLSFTTSKSGENFRDYWPQKNMRNFIGYSISLMKELRDKYGSDAFEMVHSGYNFISHNSQNPIFGTTGQDHAQDYLEEITDQQFIHNKYPYLQKDIQKIVKIKNAGSMDVYALGMLLLGEAKKLGLKQLQGEILGIEKIDSKYKIQLDSNNTISVDKVVIAAGPFVNKIAGMLGIHFPLSNTLQRKFIIPDPKNIIPKNMPFTIYTDPQYLDWSKEEADFFASDIQYKWLLNNFPGGLHIKPETEGIKMGWAFQTEKLEPAWRIPDSDYFPQAVLKGASRFIPELAQYENHIPSPLIEYAGYYTRTNENYPLIGPTEMPEVFVVGALAGYGTMSACAAGKLCSSYILNETIYPDYARYFHPLRYKDFSIVKEMNEITSDGQL
ncbi:Glycine/D-amino acid oxidase [Flavobacteriaceae bacterium MAR_2010_188]|nr:Glycine/D-amino acid oxidase [Flavobacteriaceae bacterium MAR_2010_188]